MHELLNLVAWAVLLQSAHVALNISNLLDRIALKSVLLECIPEGQKCLCVEVCVLKPAQHECAYFYHILISLHTHPRAFVMSDAVIAGAWKHFVIRHNSRLA